MPLIICVRAECSSEISETMPGDLSSYKKGFIPLLNPVPPHHDADRLDALTGREGQGPALGDIITAGLGRAVGDGASNMLKPATRAAPSPRR